jgi:SPP1 gp7 family putative phage head morphogenesis protein
VFLALRQAEEELSAGLRKWLEDAKGEDKFTAQQMRMALANTQEALRAIKELDPAMAHALEMTREGASVMAVGHAQQQLQRFSIIFDQDLKPLNINVAAIHAKGDRLLIRKHRTSAARYSEEMKRHIQRQLAVGVIKGETFDAMAGRLTRLAGPKFLRPAGVDVAADMARGLMRLPKSRALLIVRTEAIHAYNTYHLEAINEMAEDDPEMMKRWDSSLDRRGCVTCRDLDDEVRKPEEVFSTGVMHPPQHPNCRCTVVPWMESWKHTSKKSSGTEGIDAPGPKPPRVPRT